MQAEAEMSELLEVRSVLALTALSFLRPVSAASNRDSRYKPRCPHSNPAWLAPASLALLPTRLVLCPSSIVTPTMPSSTDAAKHNTGLDLSGKTAAIAGGSASFDDPLPAPLPRASSR